MWGWLRTPQTHGVGNDTLSSENNDNVAWISPGGNQNNLLTPPTFTAHGASKPSLFVKKQKFQQSENSNAPLDLTFQKRQMKQQPGEIKVEDPSTGNEIQAHGDEVDRGADEVGENDPSSPSSDKCKIVKNESNLRIFRLFERNFWRGPIEQVVERKESAFEGCRSCFSDLQSNSNVVSENDTAKSLHVYDNSTPSSECSVDECHENNGGFSHGKKPSISLFLRRSNQTSSSGTSNQTNECLSCDASNTSFDSHEATVQNEARNLIHTEKMIKSSTFRPVDGDLEITKENKVQCDQRGCGNSDDSTSSRAFSIFSIFRRKSLPSPTGQIDDNKKSTEPGNHESNIGHSDGAHEYFGNLHVQTETCNAERLGILPNGERTMSEVRDAGGVGLRQKSVSSLNCDIKEFKPNLSEIRLSQKEIRIENELCEYRMKLSQSLEFPLGKRNRDSRGEVERDGFMLNELILNDDCMSHLFPQRVSKNDVINISAELDDDQKMQQIKNSTLASPSESQERSILCDQLRVPLTPEPKSESVDDSCKDQLEQISSHFILQVGGGFNEENSRFLELESYNNTRKSLEDELAAMAVKTSDEKERDDSHYDEIVDVYDLDLEVSEFGLDNLGWYSSLQQSEDGLDFCDSSKMEVGKDHDSNSNWLGIAGKVALLVLAPELYFVQMANNDRRTMYHKIYSADVN